MTDVRPAEASNVKPDAAVLRVEKLSLTFVSRHERTRILSGIDLRIDAGEIVGLVGESGSGKSVTARAVLGQFWPPRADIRGSVEVAGQAVFRLEREARRTLRSRSTAFIGQEPLSSMNPVRRIGAQMTEIVCASGDHHRRAAEDRCRELLSEVQITDPDRVMRSFPHELSGGMLQRAAIAAAFAKEPKLILADEPTTALDVTVQAQVLAVFARLARKNRTAVLLITHDLGVVAEVCDRVYVMQQGVIVESGDTEEVLTNPTADYTRALLTAVPGRTRDASAGRGDGSNRITPLLQFSNVRVSYGERNGAPADALVGVDLMVYEGERLGVIGESGSGKTTLARAALGLVLPAEGAIAYRGRDLPDLKPEIRREIQIVFQDPRGYLNPRWPVWRILTEPLAATETVSDRFRRATAAELLALVELPESLLDRQAGEMSGGQRQRLAIARALAVTPKLLILDEPTSALDVTVQAQILRLLKRIQQEKNLTFLFISHDMGVVENLCERVAVMRKGRIVEIGETRHIVDSPTEEYTRRLMASVPRLPGGAPDARADTRTADISGQEERVMPWKK